MQTSEADGQATSLGPKQAVSILTKSMQTLHSYPLGVELVNALAISLPSWRLPW